jgi:hypothetical protein
VQGAVVEVVILPPARLRVQQMEEQVALVEGLEIQERAVQAILHQ